MRLEYIPVVIGAIFALVAALILFDAMRGADPAPPLERRRRQRAELDIPGEWLVGIGVACLSAVLVGGERWRWTTVAVMAGSVLLIFGAVLNRHYLREMLLFRGASRRTQEHETPPIARPKDEQKLRIR